MRAGPINHGLGARAGPGRGAIPSIPLIPSSVSPSVLDAGPFDLSLRGVRAGRHPAVSALSAPSPFRPARARRTRHAGAVHPASQLDAVCVNQFQLTATGDGCSSRFPFVRALARRAFPRRGVCHSSSHPRIRSLSRMPAATEKGRRPRSMARTLCSRAPHLLYRGLLRNRRNPSGRRPVLSERPGSGAPPPLYRDDRDSSTSRLRRSARNDEVRTRPPAPVCRRPHRSSLLRSFAATSA